MINISEKICKENQNTYFMLSNFFFEKRVFYETTLKKYRRAIQATGDNLAHEHWLLDN